MATSLPTISSPPLKVRSSSVCTRRYQKGQRIRSRSKIWSRPMILILAQILSVYRKSFFQCCLARYPTKQYRDRDPKPAKQKVVYKLKNINTQPIATFVFKYQSGRPTPIITPTRNNSLYSIPMYTPESAKVDTTPRTPEPSGRKRSRESEANDQVLPLV